MSNEKKKVKRSLGGKSFAKTLAAKKKASHGITYAELMGQFTEKAEKAGDRDKVWLLAVDEVKKLVGNGHLDRMAIAGIAQRACYIIHGGDYKSKEFRDFHQPHTLRKFATDTELSHRKLCNWVLTKRFVFDRLPAHLRKDFVFSKGEMARHDLNKQVMKKHGVAPWSTFGADLMERIPVSEIIEVYERYATNDNKIVWRRKLVQIIGTILTSITEPEKSKYYTDAELQKINMTAREIVRQSHELMVTRQKEAVRGRSLIGKASPSQGEGSQFKAERLHKLKKQHEEKKSETPSDAGRAAALEATL